MLKMVHPEIEAAGEALDRATFNQIWAPRGWVLLDDATSYANDQLGRFVRDAAAPKEEGGLTVDEARGLIAQKGGDYPGPEASGEEVRATFSELFTEAAPRPTAPTETATGVPIKQYDPSEYNVDEVQAHLATVDEDEQLRILQAEEAGKNRVTITSWTPAPPADSTDAGQEN